MPTALVASRTPFGSWYAMVPCRHSGERHRSSSGPRISTISLSDAARTGIRKP